jgi:hypothetical protein
MLTKSIAVAVFALLLGYLVAPVSAAPLASMTGAKNDTSATEQVNYRRCWWRNGHRHCRWVGDGYGYGPGVNLYFGGRGHRSHGDHHRR